MKDTLFPDYGSRGRRSASAAGPEDGAAEVETVEGLLDHVTFANEETGWSVIRLLGEGKAVPFTAVGHLPGVRLGETLRLRGRWVRDRRFGEQFKVQSFLPVLPSTLVGMERYLSSGLVSGIGKVMAARLVARFGFETLDVIEREPLRLSEVEGIGEKRRHMISAAWKEQRGVRDVMLFLQSHGVGTAHAYRIYRRYGDGAIAAVRDNPYRLATEVSGIGFRMADRIAASLGIVPTAPRRIEAGLLYALTELAGRGHLFAPRPRLLEEAAAILETDIYLVEEGVESLLAQGALVGEPYGEELACYLPALHEAESEAARLLCRLLKEGEEEGVEGVEGQIDRFEADQGVGLAPLQRKAVRRAVAGSALVVTGGPGTGKTTIINAIVRIMERRGAKVLLCSPTGRASKRMEEASGREARTIHRLLEFNPRRQRFERHEGRLLAADLIVVDEMSMVDAPLFWNFLRAVPPACRLVMVGDVDQLPSVGPGNVLRDLIGSDTIEVVRLDEVFRQARESMIITNAHRVNRGETPRLPPSGEEGDFWYLREEDSEGTVRVLRELLSRRIPSRLGVDPLRDVQVLTPMNKGALGAVSLNVELQAALNPRGESLNQGGRHLRCGDKVMQIRNNYDLGVFNGDLGRIEAVDREERQVTVRFEERLVTYEWSDLDELLLGYACTVHKSQGSEYPVVIVILHMQHYPLLQRNLLYTAITRGRRLVVVLGSKRAFSLAVRRNRVVSRYTRLAELLARGRGG